jgi:hypothetical protein
MITTLSIIATVISSIALIGVAIGVILQARQLRANQLQAMRGLHLEIMKISIDNPALAVSTVKDVDVGDATRGSFLNLTLKFLETGYSFKTISKASVSLQAARLFESEYSRVWWAQARVTYEVEGTTKREKEFFGLVDARFQDAMRTLQSSSDTTTKLQNKAE